MESVQVRDCGDRVAIAGMRESGADLDNGGGHVRYSRKPVGAGFRVVVLIACLLVGVAVQATLSTPAYSCSIAAFPKDAPAIRFTGRAVRHELTIDSGPLSSTFDWTFVVTKWDRSSAGPRRKVGAKITISVVQSSPNPPPTTALPNGAVRPCDGIQFGVTTEFLARGTYNVVAIVHEATNQKQYIVSNFVGSLTSTGKKSLPPRLLTSVTVTAKNRGSCVRGSSHRTAAAGEYPTAKPLTDCSERAAIGANADRSSLNELRVRRRLRRMYCDLERSELRYGLGKQDLA